MLLENGQGVEKDLQETNGSADDDDDDDDRTEDIIQQLNQKYPQKELKVSKVSDSDFDKMKNELQVLRDNNCRIEKVENDDATGYINFSAEACVGETNGRKIGKSNNKSWEKKLVRSESAKVLSRIPSSPSLFQGMKSSIKIIKKALRKSLASYVS
ncbi:hypothetical protein L195_g051452 [Trifolium pratense]|uniref:Uncharacterized protein n=1 Tax=Trifolium pratense TaxID=57577 RepID=A0A2K3JZN7_TRIPR|nr:hypothetical protein L195_g051452 [Trifolium pratense]